MCSWPDRWCQTSPEATCPGCVPSHKPIAPWVLTKFSKDTLISLEGAGCYQQRKEDKATFPPLHACPCQEELSSVDSVDAQRALRYRLQRSCPLARGFVPKTLRATGVPLDKLLLSDVTGLS